VILVCPLSCVLDLVTTRQPTRVVSALDPNLPFPDLGPTFNGRHLRLAFHDVHHASPGIIPPATEHVQQLLVFLDEWDDTRELLLIHCRAGISRSTAFAYIAACYRNPDVSELLIARELRRVAPNARPNERIIELADTAMSRDRRMLTAILETGRGLGWLDMMENEPFELPSRFDGSATNAG
jgi:predicted protein tyrosine phosphatase